MSFPVRFLYFANMLLSIIVPLYNEETTAGLILEKLFRADFGSVRKEIIAVNDGSTDGTRAVLESYKDRLLCISHEKNRGKGAAVRTGLTRASGALVIVQDGDLEYDPAEISKLLEAFERDAAVDAVFGSRNLAPTGRGYSHYVLGAWVLTACVNVLFRTHLTDVYTCYKLVRLDVLRSLGLYSRGFEMEMELTAKLLKREARIKEVPISYSPRSFREGKKIRAFDGIKGISTLLRVLLFG